MERFLTIMPALSLLVLLLGACGVPSNGATDRSQPQPDHPPAGVPTSLPSSSATPLPEAPTVAATAQASPAASATLDVAPTAVQARPQAQPSTLALPATQATLPCSTSPAGSGTAQLPQSGTSSGQAQSGAAGSPVPVSTAYPANAPNQATREAALDRVNRSGPVATGPPANPCP